MDYTATLQIVNGHVYELKGLDSAFHLHHPNSGTIAFFAPEHYNNELFVQLKSGDQFIFEQVSEKVLASLEPEGGNIDQVYEELLKKDQPKRTANAELLPVELKDLLDVFCKMQYHITVTNGLWATDEPDKFKDHPAHHLLWQIGFKDQLAYEKRV